MKSNHTAIEPGTATDDWLLWQLADSAFPTGGFAHSGGLEAAWQHGEVRTSAEIQEFVHAGLTQLLNGIFPFMTAAHETPGQYSELDIACDSFLTNHVANRASRLQGRALLASATRIFGEAHFSSEWQAEYAHLAPIFGFVMRKLAVEHARASRLFVFWHLRGWLASAVRLGLIGPNEAQSMQHGLGIFAEELLKRFERKKTSAPFQTAPLLEIWQGAHDRLYSRLFQS
ncbi:MAG TPA: urease accessory UreF family protein [Verrucomicrobiae bacterium]|nr:urease accessory UreF family protein [Verrucomicrobiae bacterium]